MAIVKTEEVREFLRKYEGREITLTELRTELQIEKGSQSFDEIRDILFYLKEKGVVKPTGRRGVYKVIKRVQPIPVFSIERERRPPFQLIFPKDYETKMEFPFAEKVVIREGDCILIAGQSNFGKTALSMNICGENINYLPILLGNEFSKDDEPAPRFLGRLDTMKEWVEWVDEEGNDKFTLLPVFEDFAENIVKDRINIIDWINLPGEYYLISPIMEGIKRAVGRGIAVVVLQKNEGVNYGRGGALTKDFADLELLIDSHGITESRLTVGKCKEYSGSVIGRSWAFYIESGVKLTNIREVKKCRTCYNKGYTGKGECDTCRGVGWVDV